MVGHPRKDGCLGDETPWLGEGEVAWRCPQRRGRSGRGGAVPRTRTGGRSVTRPSAWARFARSRHGHPGAWRTGRTLVEAVHRRCSCALEVAEPQVRTLTGQATRFPRVRAIRWQIGQPISRLPQASGDTEDADGRHEEGQAVDPEGEIDAARGRLCRRRLPRIIAPSAAPVGPAGHSRRRGMSMPSRASSSSFSSRSRSREPYQSPP